MSSKASFSPMFMTLKANMAPMVVLVLVILGANAKSASNLQSANQMAAASEEKQSKNKTLISCIDDSDCVKLGEGNHYACFAYICYPWKDDSELPEEDKMQKCKKANECKQGQGTCVRHSERRTVDIGLCFDELSECEDASECSGDNGCCGGYCCPPKFFKQYTDLPCLSDIGCQGLGLGQFCCPQENENISICCNQDPNAPIVTTEKPVNSPSIGGAVNVHMSSKSFFLAIATVIFLKAVTI